MKFFFNSSLHKLNTSKTGWIDLKLFVQTGITTLKHMCKLHHVSPEYEKKKGVITSEVLLIIYRWIIYFLWTKKKKIERKSEETSGVKKEILEEIKTQKISSFKRKFDKI